MKNNTVTDNLFNPITNCLYTIRNIGGYSLLGDAFVECYLDKRNSTLGDTGNVVYRYCLSLREINKETKSYACKDLKEVYIEVSKGELVTIKSYRDLPRDFKYPVAKLLVDSSIVEGTVKDILNEWNYKEHHQKELIKDLYLTKRRSWFKKVFYNLFSKAKRG